MEHISHETMGMLAKSNVRMALHHTIGKLGEDIAVLWLRRTGYTILERNFRKKWGEIDVIAQNMGVVHFIEVKSVSHGTKSGLDAAISHETWRPEENVHRDKLKRLGRAIETWVAEKNYQGKWQVDVFTVKLVRAEKYARVQYIENVIFE